MYFNFKTFIYLELFVDLIVIIVKKYFLVVTGPDAITKEISTSSGNGNNYHSRTNVEAKNYEDWLRSYISITL